MDLPGAPSQSAGGDEIRDVGDEIWKESRGNSAAVDDEVGCLTSQRLVPEGDEGMGERGEEEAGMESQEAANESRAANGLRKLRESTGEVDSRAATSFLNPIFFPKLEILRTETALLQNLLTTLALPPVLLHPPPLLPPLILLLLFAALRGLVQAVLEGFQDLMDEMAIWGGIPPDPEAGVASEAAAQSKRGECSPFFSSGLFLLLPKLLLLPPPAEEWVLWSLLRERIGSVDGRWLT